MKHFFYYSSIVIFSIFIGSQITEGVLLVPYWQSLSSTNFYSYYNEFGPSIGRFYTVLTIIAALVPLFLSIYCKKTNSNAFKLALSSSFFAILFVSSFYIYFKGTNELFYQAAFSDIELKNELVIWSYWHWGRVVIEFISLIFLILAFNKVQNNNIN
ncbi:MAG: hypothetical protein ACPG5B_15725 [Chitinophagales bacterium]